MTEQIDFSNEAMNPIRKACGRCNKAVLPENLINSNCPECNNYLIEKERLNLNYLNSLISDYGKLKTTEYKEMKTKVEAVEKELEEIENQIKEAALKYGKTYDHMSMKISYRKGSTRTGWDTKKLMEYSEINPEILNFQKTSLTKAGITIKHRNIEFV